MAERLVFVMEMSVSLSPCQMSCSSVFPYGIRRRVYFTLDNLQLFEHQMLQSHLNPPSEIMYLPLYVRISPGVHGLRCTSL